MNTPWRAHRTLLPALLIMTVTSTAWGAAYRWTDSSGNVQYGDQPPAGVQAQRMQAPPPPPIVESAADTSTQPATDGTEGATSGGDTPAEAAGSEGTAAPTAEALARDQQRQAQEQRQQAQVRQRNCQAARNNLEMLQRNRPMRVDQGDGKRSKRYSAEERQAAIREAQKQIRENCN